MTAYTAPFRHISRLILAMQLIAAAILAAGCHDHRADSLTLDRADALMEVYPDSAYAILRNVDSLRLKGRNAALYNLLKAQVCHKLGLPMPPDSTLDTSIDYFKEHHADTLLMKSLFYRAAYRKSINDFQNAVCDASYSFETASSGKNNYWQAKNAELIADIFEQCINYPDGIRWRRIAADRYRSSDRQDNYLFSLCDLARAYAIADSTRQADSLFRHIRHQVEVHPEITNLKIYYTFAALNYYTLYADSLTQALRDSLYDDLNRQGMTRYLPATVNIARARMLADSSRFAEAERLLDSIRPYIISEIDRNILFDAYVRLYNASGNQTARMAYSDSIIAYQKNIVKIALEQSATAAQRNYFQSRSHSNKIEAQKNQIHLRNAIIISVLIIIIAGFIAVLYLRSRRKEITEKRAIIGIISEQLETKERLAGQLQQQLDDISKINDDLNNEILSKNRSYNEQIREIAEQKAIIGIRETELRDQKQIVREQNDTIREMTDLANETRNQLDALSRKLYESDARHTVSSADRWEPLNALCREINDSHNDNSDRIIVSNLRKVVENYKSKDFLNRLENDLNRDLDNIVMRLRSQCPGLKEGDISFCILNFSRIPSASIAIITGASITNCYVRRKRIRNKIINSSAKDKDEFLSHIKG